MNRRPISSELIAAVVELTTCKPHLPVDARFTDESWRIYCAGYSTALTWAVKVMYSALERRRVRLKYQAAAAREKRAELAAQAATPPPPPKVIIVRTWSDAHDREQQILKFPRPVQHSRRARLGP